MSSDEIRPGVPRDLRLDLHRADLAGDEGDQELEALLQEEIAYRIGRGATPEDARAAALSRLGRRPAGARRRVRASSERRARRLHWRDRFRDAVAEVRYGLRALRRSPALLGAATLTLALAIGANASIFSAVSAVLLRPLPFQDPDRLVALWEENPNFGWQQQDAAPANMLDWKEQAGVFTDVAAYAHFHDGATLTGRGEPVVLQVQQVTGNFFSVLGVRARLGRIFEDRETWSSGGTPVAILSDRAWRDRFGGDPAIVGQTVTLDGGPVEIVGVLPAAFVVPELAPDVWRPMGWSPERRTRSSFRRAHWLRVIARLAPGVSLDRADAGLQVVVTRLQRDYPVLNAQMGAGLTPLHEFMVGRTRLPLLVMLGAVGALLLIACANVANLLLVRAAGRERENALRLALGAGRGRLLRQSLIESAVLAGLGGAAGLALGWIGTRMLATLQPEGLLPVQVRMSWSALGYAAAATGLAALIFGVAPVVRQRREAGDVLRDEGRSATGTAGGRRFAGALLVTQIALAITLALGAGLLLRSYLLLLRVDPGFDSHQVLAVELEPRGDRYDTIDEVTTFYDELRRQTRALPGVQAVAVASKIPLGPPSWTSEFAVAGRPPMAPGAEIVHRAVSSGYLDVMRVPLVAGRMIAETDGRATEAVIVVNQAFVRSYFPNESPIGRRITYDRLPDSTAYWRTVVGIVGDERQDKLSVAAGPEVFEPLPQEPRSAMTLLVRTAGDPTGSLGGIRKIVAGLDPAIGLTSVRTMEEVRAASLARDRFLTTLLGMLALVGLVLSLVGIYGVAAQVARRRRRELGIRLALGARTGQVQWLVVRRGVGLAGLGIGLGLAGAAAVTGVVRSLLYQVAPSDPLTFLAVPLAVLATAAAASYLPAARAGRTDPTEVLRAD